MNEYIVITVRYISGLFKNAAYSDRKYVYDARAFLMPDNETEIIATEQKFKTLINKTRSASILIQSIVRQRYQFEIDITETQKIDHSKAAGQFIVYDEYGISYDAFVESIEYERQETSGLYRALLTFVKYETDLNSLSNYCDTTQITDRFGLGALNYIEFFGTKNVDIAEVDFESGATLKFYTMFEIYSNRSELQKSVIQLNSGIDVITNTIDFKQWKVRLYLTPTELNLFKKYASRSSCRFYSLTEGTVTSEAPITFEDKNRDDLIELHEIDVYLFTDHTNFYNL